MMKREVRFKTAVTSMLRNGPVDGNAVRIELRDATVSMEVCYGLCSTARGHVSVPADPATLRAVSAAYSQMAEAVERMAEEPDEVVVNEYEPDEVVMPEVYQGLEPMVMCGRCYEEADEVFPANCEEKPEKLIGQPIGQYHCPDCGAMVLAGLPHPPLCKRCLDWKHPGFDEEAQ